MEFNLQAQFLARGQPKDLIKNSQHMTDHGTGYEKAKALLDEHMEMSIW